MSDDTEVLVRRHPDAATAAPKANRATRRAQAARGRKGEVAVDPTAADQALPTEVEKGEAAPREMEPALQPVSKLSTRIFRSDRARVPPQIDGPGRMRPLVVPRTEAARLLGNVHPVTVTKWVLAGELERVRLGRRSMITVASIEAFVRRARAASAARGKQAKPPELVGARQSSRKGARGPKSPELAPAL
jgi:hypothetical protein